MINVLSCLGMGMQSEVCLWTMVGLVRTIFDATLFKVNANLKQVWQMSMPPELSLPVQRVLRTMISGVMLVQCFTVYIYLASYIVLLYPVFLEERPNLVLPWLLLAAIRWLLCELTSLAIGLGTCVLIGPARPPCITFVIVKLIYIMPVFYMWMLVYNFYHSLKLASTFKTFSANLPTDPDYGLELAVRRRRTKSLQGEDQLRCKLVARLYGQRLDTIQSSSNIEFPPFLTHTMITKEEKESHKKRDKNNDAEQLAPVTIFKQLSLTETGSFTCDDFLATDLNIPRGTDRILEQFVLMLLRIGVYLTKQGPLLNSELFVNQGPETVMSTSSRADINCPLPPDDTDTPPQVGSKGNTASYVLEYPQIFMKKPLDNSRQSDTNPFPSADKIRTLVGREMEDSSIIKRIKEQKKRAVPLNENENIARIEKYATLRTYLAVDRSVSTETEESDVNIESKPKKKESNLLKQDMQAQIDVSSEQSNDREICDVNSPRGAICDMNTFPVPQNKEVEKIDCELQISIEDDIEQIKKGVIIIDAEAIPQNKEDSLMGLDDQLENEDSILGYNLPTTDEDLNSLNILCKKGNIVNLDFNRSESSLRLNNEEVTYDNKEIQTQNEDNILTMLNHQSQNEELCQTNSLETLEDIINMTNAEIRLHKGEFNDIQHRNKEVNEINTESHPENQEDSEHQLEHLGFNNRITEIMPSNDKDLRDESTYFSLTDMILINEVNTMPTETTDSSNTLPTMSTQKEEKKGG